MILLITPAAYRGGYSLSGLATALHEVRAAEGQRDLSNVARVY